METNPPPGNGGVQAFSVEDPNHPNPHRPKGDESAVVILIPLVASDGRPFAVTEALVERYRESYPGIDVAQSLRNIRNWNLDSPKKRKTPAGVPAHITGWLAKDQNKAGRGGGGPGGHQPSKREETLNGLEGYRRPEGRPEGGAP